MFLLVLVLLEPEVAEAGAQRPGAGGADSPTSNPWSQLTTVGSSYLS